MPSENITSSICRRGTGFPHPRVDGVYQDRTGYMGFGTGDGLNRFEGHEILVVRPDGWNSPEPYTTYIRISEGPGGTLWIGTGWIGLPQFGCLARVQYYRRGCAAREMCRYGRQASRR